MVLLIRLLLSVFKQIHHCCLKRRLPYYFDAADSMPSQLDAKIYSLTFKLLFTSGVGDKLTFKIKQDSLILKTVV